MKRKPQTQFLLNAGNSGPTAAAPPAQHQQLQQQQAPPPLSPLLRRESRDRMRSCIPEMLRTYPFFGFLALRMPLVADDARISIAADGRNIYYNPRWVSEHNPDELQYAIARVTMACALKHHTRRGDRDYSRWQLASRLVTRHFLKDSGLTPSLKDGADNIDAGAGINQSVEQVYELLQNMFPDQPGGQPGQGQGQDKSGQGSGQGSGQSGSGQSGGQGQSQGSGNGRGQGRSGSGQRQNQSQHSGQRQPGSGPGQSAPSGGGSQQDPSQQNQVQDPGSGRNDPGQQDQQRQPGPEPDAGSPAPETPPDQNEEPQQPPQADSGSRESPRPGEPSPPDADPHGQGEVMDRPPGRDPAEDSTNCKEEEQRWDQALHKAVQFAKSQGRSPGNIAEFITAMHQSQVEWRELLRRFIYAHARTDYSWARPNQRYLSQGLYLPALDNPALPPLVLAIDTSGSMSSEELAQIWSEIHQLAAELEPEAVHVIQCDTRVSAADKYRPGDLPDELQARGRGGTLFSPAFDHVDENLDRKPACMIYCTDLYCNDYPDPPPDYPVHWLVTGRHKPEQDPPFGERIDLDSPEQL